MFKHFILIFFILFNQSVGFAQKSKLNDEIDKLKKDVAMKHATWSICVMPAKKDTVIAEYNSALSLVPASTMKIVTTGAALSILGSNFKFETKLQYDGILDTVSGVLKGNLFITGGGDPTLESEYFKDGKDSITLVEKWATILKEKGIKKIEGAVIADASIFDDNMIPSQSIWGDIGNYFGAGACGLTYMDNKYTVHLKSGEINTKTIISSVVPNVSALLVNHVTAGGNKDNAIIYGAPYSDYRTIEGTIPPNKKDYEISGSMPDPALFCAKSLAIALKKAGVKITKESTTVRAEKDNELTTENFAGYKKAEYEITKRTTLYTNYSPSLDKIVYWTNFKSINLYAEHLLKFICYKKYGKGTEDEGTEIIKKYWKDKNVDVSGFFMNDGCGLSRSNVITTKTEVQILRYMTMDKNYKAFYNSLPIAGNKGSLGGLCEGTYAANNLCAKSGYINRARGYTGYVKNKKSELLCFSLLVNNYECSPTEMKNKLEKLLIAIAEME